MASNREPTVEGSLAISHDMTKTADVTSVYDSTGDAHLSKERISEVPDISSPTESIGQSISSVSLTRQIIRRTSKEQYQSLLSRRKVLILEEMSRELRRNEVIELRLIDWELDRIEDALTGEFLDKLEKYANIQEEFAQRLTRITDVWGEASRRSRKGRRRK